MTDSSSTSGGEVKLHFLDYWKVIKNRAVLIVLVFCLIMVTAAITTWLLPRKYIARVTMEVKPDNYKGPGGGIFERGGTGFDPQFVATQFQILRKAEILMPVVEQLELVKYYSEGGPMITPQMAMNILNAQLKLEEVKNTGLIEVGAWDKSKDMAANIANTISIVYRNQRIDMTQQGLNQSLKQFRDEVDKQHKVMEEAYVKAASLRAQLGINDPDLEGGTSQGVMAPSDKTPMTTENALNEQRVKVTGLRTTLAQIQELKPEALLEALRQLGIDSPTVAQNQPLLHQAMVEETNYLSSGLGEKHPRILALRAKMETLRSILTNELVSIRRAEATKLTVEEDRLASLEKAFEEQTKTGQKLDKSSYVEAKARYAMAKDVLKAAEQRLATATMEKNIDQEPVHIWEKATPPLFPEYPDVKKFLGSAFIIGIVMGVLLAFFIEYLDTSVKGIDDVERYLKTSVLAVIPKGIPMLARIRGEHPDAESYRILRANIEFSKPSPDAKTLTVISAGPGEGKSTTLNNLAFTCAKGGYNVLIIDADLRRPTQHTFFDTENGTGLVDYLLGTSTLDAVTRTTKIDNLSFIPAGILPPDSVGILNSEPMTRLIEKVKSQYDLIFFDSPPILGVSDGSVLASEMDMTVLVVQHRRFPRAMLLRVKQAVEQVGGALVGVVLNNVDTRADEGYSAYNAYQDYYSAPKGQIPERRAPATPMAPRKALPAPAPAPARHIVSDGSDY
jgi:capsular exopolysaccharide synthesis family protein